MKKLEIRDERIYIADDIDIKVVDYSVVFKLTGNVKELDPNKNEIGSYKNMSIIRQENIEYSLAELVEK